MMPGGLIGAADRVCRELLAMFPGAVITSGRRYVHEQARAMAENVMRSRSWIGDTYRQPLCLAASQLHALAQSHSKAGVDELSALFTDALQAYPEGELRKLSRHITGEAFDVRPASHAVQEFLHDAAIREGGRFLTREGGLVIWHWQGP